MLGLSPRETESGGDWGDVAQELRGGGDTGHSWTRTDTTGGRAQAPEVPLPAQARAGSPSPELTAAPGHAPMQVAFRGPPRMPGRSWTPTLTGTKAALRQQLCAQPRAFMARYLHCQVGLHLEEIRGQG